jgi:hypothetical protein
MVQIQVSRVIPDPEPAEWRGEDTFERGDGVWTLVLHDPNEFRMGAYAWKAKLLCNDCDVSADHQILKSLGMAFRLPMRYAPWCRSRPVLALACWDSALHLYDVDSRKSIRRDLGHYPIEIQCAPTGELIAITCDQHVRILDTSAEDVASIGIRHPKYEYPAVFWWRDGKRILVVGRESQSAKTHLSVFDSTSSQLLGITDFDPLELLPYDHAGPGNQAVKYRFDTWSQIEFDIDHCLLRGTVYRPEGPRERMDGTYVWAARERSIEVIVSI